MQNSLFPNDIWRAGRKVEHDNSSQRKNRCLQEGIYHLTEKTFRLFSQSYRITPFIPVCPWWQFAELIYNMWTFLLLAAKRPEQESLQDLTELISGAAGHQHSNLRDRLCSRWVAGVSVVTAWPVEINQACEEHFFNARYKTVQRNDLKCKVRLETGHKCQC